MVGTALIFEQYAEHLPCLLKILLRQQAMDKIGRKSLQQMIFSENTDVGWWLTHAAKPARTAQHQNNLINQTEALQITYCRDQI